MNRENYYLLLELNYDPPEHDKCRIDAAITGKQAQWSKLRNHPSKGREAQMYLDMLPDIKALMENKQMREEEAKEAKVKVAQQEKKKFKDIDDAIRLLSAKKSISEEELEKLAKKFSVSEDLLRKRIKVPIVKKEAREKKVQPLDASVWKKISAALAILQKDSLYHFLDLSPKSSLKTLMEKANEMATEIKKDSRKNAVLTAGLELTGHCVNVFKTRDMKDRHDVSMAHQGLDQLNQAIEVAGLDGIVEAEEFDGLMKKALGLGLSYEEAEEHIYNYCSKRKWRVKGTTRPPVDEMKQCAHCGIMNGSDARNCTSCGYPLDLTCPKCNKVNRASNANCGNCGFAIGDMLNAIPLLRNAKTSWAGGDMKKTAQRLLKVLYFWPAHPEAQGMLQQIKDKEKEIDNLATKLEELIHKKRFNEARQVLFRLKGKDSGHPQLSRETMINANISAAEKWIKKAAAAIKSDDVLDCFSKALLECGDCREAIDGMAKYPPDPPGKLTASGSSRSISLQWTQSPSRGPVRYILVRKPQSPPLNAQDGDVLAETSQNLVDEVDAVPGIIYYYGVYSKRGEVCSARGAIAGPVMRCAEVEDLVVTPGDRVVNLAWKAPANAGIVMVRFKPATIPGGPADGDTLPGVGREGAVATGLKNEQLYGFRIMTVYKDEKGKEIYSPGLAVRAKPVAPPEPVTDMTVSKKNNQLYIQWTPPATGAVQVIHSLEPFHVASGEVISRQRLSAIGTAVPVRNAGRLQIPVAFQGILHILPVTVAGDIAVAGNAATATSIDEVSQLKGVINSGKLYLQWEWPAGAQKVLVAYNHNAYPVGPDDAAGVRKAFTRNEYLRNSAFIIRSVEAKDYYFRLFVAAGEGEKAIYSSGCPCLVTNTGYCELYYEIHLSKSFMGKVKTARIKLFSKDGQFKIPRALLVKKSHNLPLRRGDGIPILSIEPATIGTYGEFFEIPARELGKGMFARLFFEDDSQHRRFRVMPPPRNKCELG